MLHIYRDPSIKIIYWTIKLARAYFTFRTSHVAFVGVYLVTIGIM